MSRPVLPRIRPDGAVLAGVGAAMCGLIISWAVASIAQLALDSSGSATAPAAVDSAALRVSMVLGLAAVVGRALFTVGERQMAARAASRARTELRRDLVRRVLAGSAGGPTGSAGSVANILLDQVDRIGPYYAAYLPARYQATVVPALILLVVLPISWPVALLLGLAVPLVLVQMVVFGKAAAGVAKRYAAETNRLSGYFLDRLQGLATLRALGATERATEGVAAASHGLADRTMSVLRIAFLTSTALDAALTLAIAVTATYVGLTLLGYIQLSTLTLGEGLFLLLAAPAFFAPMRALTAAHHARTDAEAAAEVIDALRTSVGTGPHTAGAPASSSHDSPAAGVTVTGEISVQNLTLRYPDRDTDALADVTAYFPPGSLTAVTGPSGAGKSTLLGLLAGQLRPTSGRVTTQPPVTWIGQRPYLFSGSIAENIALGRPDATREGIATAARAAQLDHLSLDLPLGERGFGISGGEAQRVALARALVAADSGPDGLVLLDEPSAHLDAETEQALLEVLARLRTRHTVVIATHSPAVREAGDTVLELERGRVRG